MQQSGIFAAIAAGETIKSSLVDAQVTVLEGTSHALSKVKISGGGRCNVLHDTNKPVADLLRGYPRGQKELNGVLHKRFTPQMAKEWFERRGVMLKTEEDGRMFPTTDSSQTVIDALLRAANNASVMIRYRCKVDSIERHEVAVAGEDNEKNKFKFCVSVKSKGNDRGDSDSQLHELYFDAVILATGSMPAGYKFANELGHSIVDTVPSLFTLNAKHEVADETGLLYGLAGVSVSWAQVAFLVDDKAKRRKREQLTNEGPLLITHHGLSGPAVLRLSAFGAFELQKANYKGLLRIRWAPHLGSTEQIFDDLWQLTTARPNKQVASACPFFIPGNEQTNSSSAIPKRLWASICQRAGLTEGQIWGQISKKMIRKLALQINECDIEVTGKGTFKEEFVTAGGVSLKEIDMKTMQSNRVPGLFFCGEMINVDGVTGGYNFLNCWSSGFVAGNSATQYVQE